MDVVVTDATVTGKETARLLLAGLPSPLTLRDLIRFRVREQVARHNANPAPRFNGLVQPLEAEADLNEGVRDAPTLTGEMGWDRRRNPTPCIPEAPTLQPRRRIRVAAAGTILHQGSDEQANTMER